MGGLDARFVLSRNLQCLANQGRVVSLSTLSTPDEGSPIANMLVGPEPDMLDTFPTSATERFHAKGLCRRTELSRWKTRKSYDFICGMLQLSKCGAHCVPLLRSLGNESFLNDQANDGLVTLSSTALTPLAEPAWPTDHYGEVAYNLSSPTLESSFDHIAMLRRSIARAVAGEDSD